MSGYHPRNWETFPTGQLKRVDTPTTRIDEHAIQRVTEREAGFCKAAAGDYGPRLQKEFRRFVPKHPLSGALAWMRDNMRPFTVGDTACQPAPLPDDPEAVTRHIKETAYFLRADAVGVCKLPPYAVYSHSFNFKNMAAGEVPLELDHPYAIAILIDQDDTDEPGVFRPRLDQQLHEHDVLRHVRVHRHHPGGVHPAAGFRRQGPLRPVLRCHGAPDSPLGRTRAR